MTVVMFLSVLTLLLALSAIALPDLLTWTEMEEDVLVRISSKNLLQYIRIMQPSFACLLQISTSVWKTWGAVMPTLSA